MRISNLLIATVLLVALTLLAVADYPMFGLDPGRTGNASGDAPLSNMRLWGTKPGEGYIGCGASVADGRVYVPTWPTMSTSSGLGLYCLDESDGSIIRSNSLGGNGGVSTPEVAGDRVFAGSVGPYGAPGPGDLYCISATDGSTLWNKSVGSNPGWFGVASSSLISSPGVYGDVTLFEERVTVGVQGVFDISKLPVEFHDIIDVSDETQDVLRGVAKKWLIKYSAREYGREEFECLQISGNPDVSCYGCEMLGYSNSTLHDKYYFVIDEDLHTNEIRVRNVYRRAYQTPSGYQQKPVCEEITVKGGGNAE